MNLNGHISSTDVSATGSVDSGFYEPKVSRYTHITPNAEAFGQVVLPDVSLVGAYNVDSIFQVPEQIGVFSITLTNPQPTPYIVLATVAAAFGSSSSTVVSVLGQTPTSFQLRFTNTGLTSLNPVGFSFVVFRSLLNLE